MSSRFYSLLGFALCGEDLDIDEGIDGVGEFLTCMEDAGWTGEELRAHAWRRWEAEQPWPYPLPADSLIQVDSARWYATVLEVRRAIVVDQIRQTPSRRTTLTDDERRLWQDRPPHHGPSG